MSRRYSRGECQWCHRRYRLNRDGNLYEHGAKLNHRTGELEHSYAGGFCLGGREGPVEGTVTVPELTGIELDKLEPDDDPFIGVELLPPPLPPEPESWWERHYWGIVAVVGALAWATAGFAVGVWWGAR